MLEIGRDYEGLFQTDRDYVCPRQIRIIQACLR